METRPGRFATRTILPNWASITVTVLASVAVVVLVQNLAQENRMLRATLLELTDTSATPRAPAVGDTLPAIRLVHVDGPDEATVGTLLPEGGVVAFLTTTCPFCEASLPQWNDMATSLSDAGVPFVGISLSDIEATRAYAAQHGITWPLWVVAEAASIRELRVSSVPVTVIVSAQVEIRQIWRGRLQSSDKENILQAAREVSGG